MRPRRPSSPRSSEVTPGTDWFTVYVVSPGVFAINEPRQYEGVTSFLVIGSNRAVLFDSGLGVAAHPRCRAPADDVPVTVVNSHTHFDHVGGNREFEDVRNLDDRRTATRAHAARCRNR